MEQEREGGLCEVLDSPMECRQFIDVLYIKFLFLNVFVELLQKIKEQLVRHVLIHYSIYKIVFMCVYMYCHML